MARFLKLSRFLLPFAVLFAASPSHALITWTWSFSGDYNGTPVSAAGSLQTDGNTPAAFTTYSITSISGTLDVNGSLSSITGLSTFGGNKIASVSNKVQWDGTAASPILLDAFDGFAFATSSSGNVALLCDSFNYCPADEFALSSVGQFFDGLVATSLLKPFSGPEPVPGPLPLLGAGAAFGWSRRLRRRISDGSSRL